MVSIRHRVGIYAPQEQVYEAVATCEGLASWWTRKVEGDTTPGGMLRFFFGAPEPRVVVEVVEADAPRCVVWRCVDSAEEWIGTTMTFDLKPGAEGETALMFTHADWREPVEFMHHCSTKWGYLLLGLKSGLEGGAATPYPDDLKISSWG